jgi:small-conductance mechanosensitive channel
MAVARPASTVTPRTLTARWLAALCLLAGLLLPTFASSAETTPAKPPLEVLADNLRDIDKQLTKGDFTEDQLKGWSNRLAAERGLATDCVGAAEQALQRLKADLASLGEAAKNETADVARKRREFSKSIADQERQLAECRVLVLRGNEITQRVATLYNAAMAERMFAKGPSLYAVLLDNWHNIVTLGAATTFFVREHAGFGNLSPAEWIWLALLVSVAMGLGVLLRDSRRPRVVSKLMTADGEISVGVSMLAAVLHYAPRLFAALTAVAYVYLLTYDIRPVPFINVLLYGLPVYVLVLLSIHVVLAPRAPCHKLLAVSDEQARSMARRLRVLALLTYIGYLLFSTLFSQHLPEAAYLLARGVYAALLFLNMIWALWLYAKMREQDELRWVGFLIALALVVSLGAEWSGYRNLALTLLRVIVGSLFAFGVVLTLMRLFHETYDALEQGTGPRPLRLRHLLGVAPGRAVPGLVWFRIATNVLLWSLLGYTLLRIWHVSSGTLAQVENSLFRGFKLGEVQIVPLRILLAIVLFAVLVTLARWLQTRLDRRWLTYARMDHGARDAVVTITGYVLITLAALLGLSIAGFHLQNLALIAGALSVGIGFGLQNIVNNFVSGLILLFERPVRTGDWVVVGNTEGYVKKISIRSTQIQTFDHADVIVPNSELIAHQVTNWMLHNRQGRVHIPVGVAYGSDVDKVQQILERIGRDHPSVITDGSSPDPKALFLGFGETALTFDLRCFVRNIDERAQIISDLNFAIYVAFRAEGIEMPCPNKPAPAK